MLLRVPRAQQCRAVHRAEASAGTQGRRDGITAGTVAGARARLSVRALAHLSTAHKHAPHAHVSWTRYTTPASWRQRAIAVP